MVNARLWFSTAYFLLIDPICFAVLAPFFGGGNVGAAATVGWSRRYCWLDSGHLTRFKLRPLPSYISPQSTNVVGEILIYPMGR